MTPTQLDALQAEYAARKLAYDAAIIMFNHEMGAARHNLEMAFISLHLSFEGGSLIDAIADGLSDATGGAEAELAQLAMTIAEAEEAIEAAHERADRADYHARGLQ